MGEIIKLENEAVLAEEPANMLICEEQSLVEKTSNLLAGVRAGVENRQIMSMPIAQIATLGAGVSSLIPAFRTVTQTTRIATDGLYRLVNASDGALKATKTTDVFWGALKASDGTSKMAKLAKAEPLSTTTKTVAAVNPAVVLMAAALFSVEQKLGDIAEMQKQILSFLENEKESEIEADLQTLGKIIREYKHNWDNEHYIASNHKMVLDIQRTARKQMISFQKAVSEAILARKLVVAQGKVNSAKEDLIKKFKYYRLSLVTFSMSSMLEIMLSGNFKEEYITGIKSEIESLSMEYRAMFSKCSAHLERMGKVMVEAMALKGGGTLADHAGKLAEKIPVVERGPVDEFLRECGAGMKKTGKELQSEAMKQFATVSSPETHVFTEKMEDMIRIFNHTQEICCDSDNIYLVAG